MMNCGRDCHLTVALCSLAQSSSRTRGLCGRGSSVQSIDLEYRREGIVWLFDLKAFDPRLDYCRWTGTLKRLIIDQ